MLTSTAPILGLLAGVAGIADTIPYIRDTVRGRTRPHRGTWLIWSVLAVIVCLSQRVGAAMMVPKTYRDPGSETLATFEFASLSGALAAGAVGVPDPSLLLYPAYYCLANAALAVLIYHRRKLLASQLRASAPVRILR